MEVFLIPYGPFGLFHSFRPVEMINSIVNSYGKEIKNKHFIKEIESKGIGDDLLVDTGLNIFGKKNMIFLVKMLKMNFRNYGFRNNANK